MSAVPPPATDPDLQPLGRYRRSLFDRCLSLVLAGAVLFVAIGNGLTSQPAFWYVLVPGLALIVAIVWLVPVTTVTHVGVRIQRRRVVPWSDVAEVRLVGPRDNVIRLYLQDGRQVTLYGVPAAAIGGVRRLVGTG